jgi:hypothetical protein
MTAPKLVKERLPGDRYKTAGSIEGLVEGRRTIRELTIRNAEGSLSALGALPNLETLIINGGRDLDLSELALLSETCDFVALASLTGTDLGALRLPSTVRSFGISSSDDTCVINQPLLLPSGLTYLGLSARGQSSVHTLAQVIQGVRWENVGELERLLMRAETTAAGYPLEVDLGLLRDLPRLERADIFGVRHRRSAGPSPLEPPFDGLPKTLSWLRIDTELPSESLQAQLAEYLPGGGALDVGPLYPARPANQPWWIYEPDADGSGLWVASGSLADHFADQDFAEESRALRHARAVIKEKDVALLKRLDFDQEADGTMIMASSREDLVAALALLGISAPNG